MAVQPGLCHVPNPHCWFSHEAAHNIETQAEQDVDYLKLVVIEHKAAFESPLILGLK